MKPEQHWLDLLDRLRDHAKTHDLLLRAQEGVQKWLRDESNLPLNWKPDEIRTEFRSHSLSFQHGLLSYPFIDTTLRLFHKDEEIGYYSLITTMNGKDDDDYFVLYHNTNSS